MELVDILTPQFIETKDIDQELDHYMVEKRQNRSVLDERNVIDASFDLPCREWLYILVFRIIWILALSSLAIVITYWVPTVYLGADQFNLTNLILNCVGSFIAAVATAYEGVKFQYLQTYLMYGGIKDGFCSVLTTFGNFIEDTDRLLYMRPWWLTLVNIFSTLLLAFFFYQLGRLAALKMKAGTNFTLALMVMENEEQRMMHELSISDRQLNLFATSKFRPPERLRTLHGHMLAQQDKRNRHKSPYMKLRHRIIVISFILAPFANFYILRSSAFLDCNSTFSGSTMSVCNLDLQPIDMNEYAGVAFLLHYGMCVVGTFIGTFVGDVHSGPNSVQWGTFRVNMISCVLIALAHNALMFRVGIGFSRTYGAEFWTRFIGSFCGSESSFGGLIDETVSLFNRKSCPKKVVWRNIFYNLILAIVIFLLVVNSVRMVFFYQ